MWNELIVNCDYDSSVSDFLNMIKSQHCFSSNPIFKTMTDLANGLRYIIDLVNTSFKKYI